MEKYKIVDGIDEQGNPKTFKILLPQEPTKLDTLKEIRLKRGYSRHKLAMLSKINEMTINALETGVNAPLQAKLGTLIALAKALRCKVRDFYPNEKDI
jgi:transcriptional regulator with XRE-family HTH domain